MTANPLGPEASRRLAARARLLARSPALLPTVAVVAAIVIPAATVAIAGSTLGYDFRAYYAAAARVLAHGSAYELSFTYAGPYGLFLYPPTFLPLILPFALLDVTVATWLWTVVIGVATLIGIARMPVGVRTRWLVLLLAAQSGPLLVGFKLGQVGGILLLLFVEGWRAIARDPAGDRGERAGALGFTGAVGAAIKLQPGLILAWALLTRRFRALMAAIATLGILALLATIVAGPAVWGDFASVILRASDPVGTPRNLTPGAVAYGLGLTRDAAAVIQTASMALVLVVLVWSTLRLPAVPSYLVVVVATQLLSPILWDHYSMVLLVPVAWLLDRGCRPAVLVPLATSVLTLGFLPPIAYPTTFAFTLALLTVEGQRQRREAMGRY